MLGSFGHSRSRSVDTVPSAIGVYYEAVRQMEMCASWARTLFAGLVFSFSKIFCDCCLDASAALILAGGAPRAYSFRNGSTKAASQIRSSCSQSSSGG